LARKAGKMYGSTPFETAQIDQWLEFNNTQIQPYIAAILYVLFGYFPSTQEKYTEAKKGFVEVLKILDNHLASH
jgi:glutathione S-transferase